MAHKSFALANTLITSIDGIPHTDLQTMGAADAFKAISAQSDVYSSQLRVAINADGTILRTADGQPRIDSRGYFDATGLEGRPPTVDAGSYANLAEHMPNRLSQHEAGAQILQDVQARYETLARTPDLPGVDNSALRASALRALDKLGWAGDLLALGLVAREANAAYADGNTNEGHRLLAEWAGGFAGGLAGGLLAAKIAGAALAPLYLTGPAGAMIAGGLTLLAGLAGGIAGGILGENGIRALMDDLYATWRTAEQNTSPLILDLDGDGVETVSRTQGIRFDHQADGFAENTGWAGRDDGMLVRDLNGDGSINNGRELFGNNTLLANGQNAANGFEALRALDSNADGIVSSADMAWAELRVWRDADGDLGANLMAESWARIDCRSVVFQSQKRKDIETRVFKTRTKTAGLHGARICKRSTQQLFREEK